MLLQILDPVKTPSQFLVRLELNKCGIPEAGGVAIGQALKGGNLKLRILHLSNNKLGNKSAVVFGDLLEGSHTLKELDLSWNQIKVGGLYPGGVYPWPACHNTIGFSRVLASHNTMAHAPPPLMVCTRVLCAQLWFVSS